jgi:hypothetical protein
MRYGVVRISSDLPPPSLQRRLIEAAGCDLLLDDSHPLVANLPALRRKLERLDAGDEILVHSLEVFDLTTGGLARLLRRLFEAGVILKIVGGARVETLAPEGSIPRVLALLADFESRRPTTATIRRRARNEGPPLTQHQLKFARDMHRQGHSVRAIGLLFRLAPSEMAQILRLNAQDEKEGQAGLTL